MNDGTTEIQEGMKGSKITIDSFSEEKNSMFAVNYQDKLVEVLDKLNTTLSQEEVKKLLEDAIIKLDQNNTQTPSHTHITCNTCDKCIDPQCDGTIEEDFKRLKYSQNDVIEIIENSKYKDIYKNLFIERKEVFFI